MIVCLVEVTGIVIVYEFEISVSLLQATALDVNGKHVLVTRFIKPQNPPLEISSLGDNRVHLMVGS